MPQDIPRASQNYEDVEDDFLPSYLRTQQEDPNIPCPPLGGGRSRRLSGDLRLPLPLPEEILPDESQSFSDLLEVEMRVRLQVEKEQLHHHIHCLR